MSKRGSTTYQSSLKKDKQKTIQQKILTSNAIVNNEFKTTTASYDGRAINTYSTARKPSTKNKETPFYTPTIPAIQNRQSKLTITTELPITTTLATNTDEVKHAMEMIESLKELDIDAMTSEAEKYLGQRPGLEVPPSSGPSALHSLALYFATNDSITTKRQIPLTGTSPQPNPTDPSEEEETSEASTVGITSVFLSDKTVNE